MRGEEDLTTACSRSSRTRWREGRRRVAPLRREWLVGDGAGGGWLRSRTRASFRCEKKSKRVSRRISGARGVGWDQRGAALLTGVAGVEEKRPRTVGAPASELDGLAARFVRGEEGKWSGAPGLQIGTIWQGINGLNRPQSNELIRWSDAVASVIWGWRRTMLSVLTCGTQASARGEREEWAGPVLGSACAGGGDGAGPLGWLGLSWFGRPGFLPFFFFFFPFLFLISITDFEIELLFASNKFCKICKNHNN